MRVKICGVTRLEDALHAEACGAWAVGVIVASDSRRSVTLGQAAEIFGALKPGTLSVAVTHTGDREELERVLALKPKAIQITYPFRLEPGELRVFRAVSKGEPVIEPCDAIVLDESHGQGIPLDVAYAREAIRRSRVPVILAGGLTPENVREIAMELRPYAVDVASGVERSPGIKDPARVKMFLEACRGI